MAEATIDARSLNALTDKPFAPTLLLAYTVATNLIWI